MRHYEFDIRVLRLRRVLTWQLDLREMAGRADAEGLDRCVFELDKRVGGGEFGYELQNGSVTFRGGDEASWTNI